MSRGSITPRPTKDGKVRYRIKWESRAADGSRRHHSETRANKKEAEAFLADKLKEVNDGTFVPASKETVAQFLDRWFAASAPGWTEATQHQYRGVIKKRLLPHIGHIPLARLDTLAIQQCYAALTTAGYAPKSVVGAHGLLRSALADAVAWRNLQRNPADGAKPPAAPRQAPVVWTADEAAVFLTKTANDRFAPLWRLGLDSGMRLGEMLALDWRSVDLERGVIGVSRTLTRTTTKEGWKVGTQAKTASSRRSIPIGSATVSALRTERARQAERRLRCGGSWQDLGLVFDRGNGKWIAPTTIRHAFDRAVERAGLPPMTPHGMRHTMATIMLAAGVHPKIAQERLGHSSITMTLDRYSHVSGTMQEDAAKVLELLLSGQARPKRGHDAG